MRKFFFNIFSFIFVFILLSSPALAADSNREVRRDNLMTGQVVSHDYFAAGDYVTVSGTVDGDAYVAGSNILVDGVINGDLLVAGGNIDIRGDVKGDIRVAGGQVNVSGSVGGNITALSGSFHLAPSAMFAGSLVIGAGDANIEAPVGRDITGGAKNLSLTSSVGGDVNYWSEQEISMAPTAVVSGQVTKHDVPKSESRMVNKKSVASGGIGVFTFFSFLSAFILGALLIKLAPNFVVNALEPMTTKPWGSLFMGFAFVFLAPIATLILLVTIIGMPIAGVLFLLYSLILMFAKIFAGLFVGIKVFGLIHQEASIYFKYFVGILIYKILWYIPVAGWLLIMVLFFASIGSVLIYKKDLYKTLTSKKII